jgi:hypothetical protein
MWDLRPHGSAEKASTNDGGIAWVLEAKQIGMRAWEVVAPSYDLRRRGTGLTGTRPRKGGCREERTADGKHGRERWVSQTCPRNGSG